MTGAKKNGEFMIGANWFHSIRFNEVDLMSFHILIIPK